jgi:hypothetical protein
MGNMTLRTVSLLALAAALAALLCAEAFAEDWKPIDPAHLAMKSPIVQKDADAEAIFWEVRVMDEDKGYEYHTVLNNYLRIKIFTNRGR